MPRAVRREREELGRVQLLSLGEEWFKILKGDLSTCLEPLIHVVDGEVLDKLVDGLVLLEVLRPGALGSGVAVGAASLAPSSPPLCACVSILGVAAAAAAGAGAAAAAAAVKVRRPAAAAAAVAMSAGLKNGPNSFWPYMSTAAPPSRRGRPSARSGGGQVRKWGVASIFAKRVAVTRLH
jgi:hypothetical protein